MGVQDGWEMLKGVLSEGEGEEGREVGSGLSGTTTIKFLGN